MYPFHVGVQNLQPNPNLIPFSTFKHFTSLLHHLTALKLNE